MCTFLSRSLKGGCFWENNGNIVDMTMAFVVVNILIKLNISLVLVQSGIILIV